MRRSVPSRAIGHALCCVDRNLITIRKPDDLLTFNNVIIKALRELRKAA
jgi:hypothetical protein